MPIKTEENRLSGDQVKAILKGLKLTQSDLALLDSVKLRQAQYLAQNGITGLAAVCLLLLQENPDLLPRIWELSGHPEKAQKDTKT